MVTEGNFGSDEQEQNDVTSDENYVTRGSDESDV